MLEKMHAYDNNAFDILRTEFRPADPTRLGLALSYACFYYEILNEPDRACRLAKQVYLYSTGTYS